MCFVFFLGCGLVFGLVCVWILAAVVLYLSGIRPNVGMPGPRIGIDEIELVPPWIFAVIALFGLSIVCVAVVAAYWLASRERESRLPTQSLISRDTEKQKEPDYGTW
jgi:hypothetical protein